MDACSIAHASMARPVNSLPLSEMMLSGNTPFSAHTQLSSSAPFAPLSLRSASNATHSRVNWSITVSVYLLVAIVKQDSQGNPGGFSNRLSLLSL